MAENEVSVRKNIDTETGEIVSENFLTPSEAFSSSSSLSDYFTTDPTEGLAAQAENLNALSSSDAKPLSDATNMTLKIVKFVANNVRMNDRQTGEDATFLRVVIITDDGKMYSTVSDSVKRVLGQFYNLFSHSGLKFSKETPFVAKVTLSDTKSGNKALGLQADVKAIAAYDKKSAAK